MRRFQNREQLSSLSWPAKIRTFGNTNANGEAVRKENFTSSVGIKYAKNSLALLQATFWGPLHQTPSAGSLVLCSRTCACDPKINLLASYPPFCGFAKAQEKGKATSFSCAGNGKDWHAKSVSDREDSPRE